VSNTAEQEKFVKGAVGAFVRSCGVRTFHLACHAAVPVVFTPELLHLLRVNFFLDAPEPLPYTAEADILLSPLCQELGDNLYEIPPHVRDVMLRELALTPAYGEQRMREIAALLLQYGERFLPWRNNESLERGQQLTALIFLDPPRAMSWLETLGESARLAAPGEREWFVAMRAELQKLDAVFGEAQSAAVEVPAEGESEAGSTDDGTPGFEVPAYLYDSLPFPFNQRPFSPYEPIEKRIEQIKVLVVNNLLQGEEDLSELARAEWGGRVEARLERERNISALALDVIINNVKRLVRAPVTNVTHMSEVAAAADELAPDAIVLSGTLSDFDYYNPGLLKIFCDFIHATTIPVLGIGGGHQLVGICFGARVVTLDNREPSAQREERPYENQYRFVRITDPEDPIFRGTYDRDSGLWQDYTTEGRILRVWQNHSLQLDRVPEGFRLIATSYLCRNQMMVKRSDGQLIYTVQFHLEKSFEDLWSNLRRLNPNAPPEERRRLLREEASNRTNWAHPNESRDGRLLFENFLRLALEHRG
jgi:GMP synthase-like glutamine amidotransferase